MFNVFFFVIFYQKPIFKKQKYLPPPSQNMNILQSVKQSDESLKESNERDRSSFQKVAFQQNNAEIRGLVDFYIYCDFMIINFTI